MAILVKPILFKFQFPVLLTRLVPALLAAASRQQRQQLSAQAAGVKNVDIDAMMRTLPPKPDPPRNEDCCMSRCEFCVWDLYDEDMREYQKHATAIREALEAQGKPVPKQLLPESLRDSVDPSMRAFLDMEREMKARIQHEQDESD
ncbi:hypothetical protein H4S08_004377 [Coemansia sp. RSA 1365]|nr:hypothetical protein H4S08_004377 [Coemansia sp. RSA 1365]